jgi:hypothetical protein
VGNVVTPGFVPEVVSPGLVPGPPGPNPGEVGELDEDGEFDEAGWEELVLPPPHPAIVKVAQRLQRQPRADNHLAITAFGFR